MNYKIDLDSDVPAYIQLYRKLATDISLGIYPYGSKLPSKRVMASDVGVSVITVDHALVLLNEEGFVQSRERSGAFVIYRGEDFLGGNAGKDENETTPGIGANAMQQYSGDEFPFSVLAKTMRKVLSDYGKRILIKPPNQGCIELRNEICRYLARSRGINVDPSQIVVGSGAEYLYGLIAQMLTGRTVAIEDPSYEKIKSVYTAMGLTVDSLRMTADGISSSALEKTTALALHVTPFNSFPSGITAGISKKLEYLRWAKKRGGIIIEDNYDSELTVSRKVEEPLFSMDKEADVIYINTFSGTLAPSMRIGYMIIPSHMTKRFKEKLGFYSCTVPVFDQYVIAELLKSGDFERHINRVRRRKRGK